MASKEHRIERTVTHGGHDGRMFFNRVRVPWWVPPGTRVTVTFECERDESRPPVRAQTEMEVEE